MKRITTGQVQRIRDYLRLSPEWDLIISHPPNKEMGPYRWQEQGEINIYRETVFLDMIDLLCARNYSGYDCMPTVYKGLQQIKPAKIPLWNEEEIMRLYSYLGNY